MQRGQKLYTCAQFHCLFADLTKREGNWTQRRGFRYEKGRWELRTDHEKPLTLKKDFSEGQGLA